MCLRDLPAGGSTDRSLGSAAHRASPEKRRDNRASGSSGCRCPRPIGGHPCGSIAGRIADASPVSEPSAQPRDLARDLSNRPHHRSAACRGGSLRAADPNRNGGHGSFCRALLSLEDLGRKYRPPVRDRHPGPDGQAQPGGDPERWRIGRPMPNRAKNGHPGVEHAPLLAELLFLHVQAFQLAVWCFPTYLTAILASAAP
jgi:hypothetical protein